MSDLPIFHIIKDSFCTYCITNKYNRKKVGDEYKILWCSRSIDVPLMSSDNKLWNSKGLLTQSRSPMKILYDVVLNVQVILVVINRCWRESIYRGKVPMY